MKQTGFILKVLHLSAGLSILIKYGGPILSIPATPTNADAGVGANFDYSDRFLATDVQQKATM